MGEMRTLTPFCALGFAAALSACEPDLVVATRTCFHDVDASSQADPGAPADVAVPVPWATGFEDGFCGYRDAGGYCKVNSEAMHDVVTDPTHAGRWAAAFSVVGNDASDALQARCVLRGTLPERARYGAWFYFPSYVENDADWNLFHFEGWDGDTSHKLWDVSVATAGGKLKLYLFDFLAGRQRPATRDLAITIQQWVHIEFELVRSAQAMGEVTLYQDDQLLLQVPNIVSDDSERAEWFVGNLADALVPPNSTIYVDDVTVRASE